MVEFVKLMLGTPRSPRSSLLHTVHKSRTLHPVDFGVAPILEEWHLDYAKQMGHWKIYELLLSKKMGEKALKSVEKEKAKITSSRAIANNFQRTCVSVLGERKAKDFMKKFRVILFELIKGKHPISDIFLLIIWKDKENRNTLLKNLRKTCEDVFLKIPIDRKEFLWFEDFILKSAVRFSSFPLPFLPNPSPFSF